MLLYMKPIWCDGIQEIYTRLEEGQSAKGYMCMLLYMKSIWCDGIQDIYTRLEGGQSAMGICACCSI